MKTQKFFKYQGNNEELFCKQCMDNYNVNDVIIVPDTHNAILIKDGQMMATLDSGSHEIFDKKKGVFGSVSKTESHTVDVIYMSKTYKLKILWGTPNKIESSDPLTNIPVSFGARGEFYVQIKNPRKAYLELIGSSQNFTADDLKSYLIGQLIHIVEPAISKAMREKQISYYRFSEFKKEISDAILPEIQKWCEDNYGLAVFSFFISNVMISDEDKNRIELELKRVEAEKKAKEAEEKAKKEEKDKALEDERLDDKDWERIKWLKELESKDYDKYLEVIKVIGEKKSDGNKTQADSFCSKCGHKYESSDKFCPGCGSRVGEYHIVCPNCKNENSATSSYCSKCGKKLG